MAGPNTRDANAVAGAMYFIVGRGTEGGPNSYRLSVAGVTDRDWGAVSKVVANSGYSIGTIQVDMGQRGTWGVGKTTGPAARGEQSYIDAIIGESSRYATAHDLTFPNDTAQLRADLLTHGDGLGRHSSINFIDAGVRDTINTWASSSEGKQWIHSNIDYPQVDNATATATRILDAYGTHISEDHRLASIALLAKTANQLPGQLPRLQATLEHGGDYGALRDEARTIAQQHRAYEGLKAADVADRYQAAFENPESAAAIERAQLKVSSMGFDPSSQSTDKDIRVAIAAIAPGSRAASVRANGEVLSLGAHGERVTELQAQLVSLGVTGPHGRGIEPDGHYGPATRAAVQQFQTNHGLAADGIVGSRTAQLLAREVDLARQASIMSLSDPRHPGVSLYEQSLQGVRTIDRQFGRQTDQFSCRLAGALAVGACAAGLSRVDHVVMSDDGSRAYAVQGQLNSPFKEYAAIDVGQAVGVPLEQSGADFIQASEQRTQQASLEQQSPVQAAVQVPAAPGMSR